MTRNLPTRPVTLSGNLNGQLIKLCCFAEWIRTWETICWLVQQKLLTQTRNKTKKREKPGRKNKLKSRNLMRFRMIKKTYLTVGLCAQQTMESWGKSRGKSSGEAVGFGWRIYTMPHILARWLLSTYVTTRHLRLLHRLFQPDYTAWLGTFPYHSSRIPL